MDMALDELTEIAAQQQILFDSFTQVNATEMRVMPVPDVETILQIGFEVRSLKSIDSASIETIVGSALWLPSKLLRELVAAI